MKPELLYPLLYLEINLVAVLLVLFIRIKTLGISKMVSQRNFSVAIDAQIVFFLSDTVAMMIACGLIPFSRMGLIAAKSVYFFFTGVMCFCWFIYFEHLQGSAFVGHPKAVLSISCLLWVLALLLLINLFTGILFYVDDEGVYRRGPLFIIQYILAYTYVFAACGHALISSFRKENNSRRRQLRMLAMFPVAPAGAGILQFIFPQLPLACVTLAFATLILYQNWLDDMISVDPLTRLNNRKQLAFQYEQWQRRDDNVPLYLLMIDANKFKGINDTYGHIQGDAALERIADALRLSCKDLKHRANIARYGGDEFSVLVMADEKSEIDALCDTIKNNVVKLNKKANAPYDLSVSIGIARADRGKELKALIEEADEELYEDKKN